MPYDDNGDLIIDYGTLIASTDRNIVIQKITDKDQEEAVNPVVVLPLYYWKKLVRYGVETSPNNN